MATGFGNASVTTFTGTLPRSEMHDKCKYYMLALHENHSFVFDFHYHLGDGHTLYRYSSGIDDKEILD
jgi:hypothetical protein